MHFREYSINHAYNKVYEDFTREVTWEVTWETCTLRKWLNDTFKSAIFSAEEMKAVMLSDVSEDEDIYDTKDKLFLLSIKEVEQYFVSDEKRLCEPTEYAVNKGAFENYCGNGQWWLRSAGYNSYYAVLVDDDGSVDYYGNDVHSGGCSVRPAFWLNL